MQGEHPLRSVIAAQLTELRGSPNVGGGAGVPPAPNGSGSPHRNPSESQSQNGTYSTGT